MDDEPTLNSDKSFIPDDLYQKIHIFRNHVELELANLREDLKTDHGVRK